MAKCPYCKQSLTLEKTVRDSMDHREEVHKDVAGLVKRKSCIPVPTANPFSDSVSFWEGY